MQLLLSTMEHVEPDRDGWVYGLWKKPLAIAKDQAGEGSVMGHYYGDNRRELGFPDEFGEDICQEEQNKPESAARTNSRPITPFCGYVAAAWFGPFLLSPLTRKERGYC